MKKIMLSIAAAVFFTVVSAVGFILLGAAVRCVNALITWQTPTTLEYTGFFFTAVVTGIAAAVWFYEETKYD